MTAHDDREAGGGDWRSFDFSGTGTWPEYWPPVAYKMERPDFARLRVTPPPQAVNFMGGLHGGFLAGLAENCLGLILHGEGEARAGVTISLAFDYPGGGKADMPITGEVEAMRETGKMQFLRVLLRQGDVVLLHGTGVLRKVTPR